MSAHGLAQLDSRQANPTTGAQHQQALAGLDVGPLLEGVVGGAVNHGEGGAFLVAHAFGQGQQAVFLNQHFLGKGAVTGHADHPVAGLEAGHLVANGNHFTGHLATGGERHLGLDLVLALDDQGIREVQASSLDANLDLAAGRFRAFNVLDHQLFRRAILLAENCTHSVAPILYQGIDVVGWRSGHDSCNGNTGTGITNQATPTPVMNQIKIAYGATSP